MEKEVFKRAIQEFQDLNEKTTKCREFILDKEKFESLDMINRDLLIAQLKAMETYLSVLSIRLGINGSAENSETDETLEDTIDDNIEVEESKEEGE